MNCMIIDDDTLSRRIIEEFIQKTDGLELVSSSGDPVEGDFLKDGLHVRQGIDGYANLSHFTRAQGMIGIVTDLGRKVEGHAEARLAVIQEISVALVGLLRSGKAGVLSHGPESAPVHGWLYPPRKGIFARESQFFGVIECFQV